MRADSNKIALRRSVTCSQEPIRDRLRASREIWPYGSCGVCH